MIPPPPPPRKILPLGKDYKVGDSNEWRVPEESDFYSKWSEEKQCSYHLSTVSSSGYMIPSHPTPITKISDIIRYLPYQILHLSIIAIVVIFMLVIHKFVLLDMSELDNKVLNTNIKQTGAKHGYPIVI
ncbi:BnaA06g28480D [Brassica napus]|uniref:(rape) hypothetical protein n=1 Tax=Brassica napus TaxID=3708 RepID=A0A078J8C4_BRANA|nr:unnamed protein product [Brassica napus]CDY61635.1 BnaA06g28480D [Brassica napus]